LSVLAALAAAALLVTGVIELAAVPVSLSAAITVVAGLGWLVAGVLVAAWPGITIVALAVVAGIVAPAYAPDDHVVGVAALAPASDLTGPIDDLAHVPGGSIFSAYAITAYSQTYHDVGFNQYVRPAARVISRRAASRGSVTLCDVTKPAI
jgi:hypothetical protein